MQIPYSRSVRQVSEPFTLADGDVIEVVEMDGLHLLLLNRYPMSAINPAKPYQICGDYQTVFYNEIEKAIQHHQRTLQSRHPLQNLQSAQNPQNQQPETRILRPSQTSEEPFRILHLGVAGGALALALNANYAKTVRLLQVGYDNNAELINYAREHFALLKSPDLKVRLKSAEAALSEVKQGTQNAIVLDIYDQNGKLPMIFTKLEFISGIIAKLSFGGVFLANIIDSEHSPEVVNSIAETLKSLPNYQFSITKLPNTLSIDLNAYIIKVTH